MKKFSARKTLAKVENYQPGKPIEKVRKELRLKRVDKLASNESPFGVFAGVRKAVAKELSKVNLYPLADCFYLRQRISSLFRVQPNQIIFGNGSDEIITLVLRAFVEPYKEEIIIGSPTFLIYKIQAETMGIPVREIPMKNFRYDLDKIKRNITGRTKMIFIANPDNPNSTYINHKDMRSFLVSIPKNILIFLDEAYYEFAPGDFPDSLNFLKEGFNIIFTRTFSKIYGLAGLRIGYGISRPEIIAALDKVREPFNVNRLAQAAALAALKEQKKVRQIREYIIREKENLYSALDKLGLFYVKSATNFVLIKINSAEKIYSYFLKRGIIIRKMSVWGLPDFIRVTIGRKSQNSRFLKALKNFMRTGG